MKILLNPFNDELLAQAEAAKSDKPVYKIVQNPFDILLGVILFILAFFTFGLTFILYLIYYVVKLKIIKTVRVKNVATGEIFKANKKEFFAYQKKIKDEQSRIKHFE